MLSCYVKLTFNGTVLAEQKFNPPQNSFVTVFREELSSDLYDTTLELGAQTGIGKLPVAR